MMSSIEAASTNGIRNKAFQARLRASVPILGDYRNMVV